MHHEQMSDTPKQQQIAKLNLRAHPELIDRIDRCRAEMLQDPRYGGIPSRSEFVRIAVEAFLDSWGARERKGVHGDD